MRRRVTRARSAHHVVAKSHGDADVETEARAYAHKLAAGPTVAYRYAKALINTAAGLGAAIPALIAYNFFAHGSRQLKARIEDFVMEFLNLAERNFT